MPTVEPLRKQSWERSCTLQLTSPNQSSSAGLCQSDLSSYWTVAGIGTTLSSLLDVLSQTLNQTRAEFRSLHFNLKTWNRLVDRSCSVMYSEIVRSFFFTAHLGNSEGALVHHKITGQALVFQTKHCIIWNILSSVSHSLYTKAEFRK